MRNHGIGFGAGPAIMLPSRRKELPWQGQEMVSDSCFQTVKQPRWEHTALNA